MEPYGLNRLNRMNRMAGQAATEDKSNALEGIKLYDPNGAIVSLVGLWESRPAVVAFTRHFGYVSCVLTERALSRRTEFVFGVYCNVAILQF